MYPTVLYNYPMSFCSLSLPLFLYFPLHELVSFFKRYYCMRLKDCYIFHIIANLTGRDPTPAALGYAPYCVLLLPHSFCIPSDLKSQYILQVPHSLSRSLSLSDFKNEFSILFFFSTLDCFLSSHYHAYFFNNILLLNQLAL